MTGRIVRSMPARDQPLNLSTECDEALAVRGDADSFTRLYHTHAGAVYRYLLLRLANGPDAEDVTAHVFERAWTSLPRYKPSGTFKSWLFVIAQRVLIDHYRKHPPGVRALSLDSASEEWVDATSSADGRVFASEQMRRVFRALASLSAEQQEVIRLRFMAELQYDEIAQVTGKSVSAVKMSAYRAIEDIRRRCAHDTRPDDV